jgi:hypothetical protein
MSDLYVKFRADVVAAMKNRDKIATLALRTNDAAIQRAAMDLNQPIDDKLVVATLRKSIKNLTEAMAEFAKGGRADLVSANEAEIRLLEKYLPAALEPARLDALVADAIRATGSQTRNEMGRVIAELKKRPEAPLIDFSIASKVVRSKLP